jgi:pimeloyl-ACP methyl ester carboxylesterase
VLVTADDGARLAVEVLEPVQPGPTVVLAHGWTLTRASWRPVAERLGRTRPDVRVVTYDQRDHGESQPGPGRSGRRTAAVVSIARLADDLAAVVEAVAPVGPVLLGGHSMGAMGVLALAGRRPDLLRERVCGVLLANAAAGGLARRPSLAVAMRVLAAAPPGVRVPRLPGFAARRLSYGAGAPPDVVVLARRGVRPPTARSVGAWYGALAELDERRSLAALGDVPLVVLAGEADRLTPRRHASELAASLPGARLEVVPGAGHMLPVEAPELLARRLIELLPAPHRSARSR